MRQTNVKSDRVATLLDRLTDATGESRVEALERALEERLVHVRRRDRTARLRTWLETEVWPTLPEGARGRAPDETEQDELLDMP
jgi:hypothetical protein